MDPKITIADSARFLNLTTTQLQQYLLDTNLEFTNTLPRGSIDNGYFRYNTAKELFQYDKEPIAITFQIIKGGTGKTSIAASFAIRASLYGFKVLCIDLDQQGNLTNNFQVNAEKLPVMIDILAEGYSIKQAITQIYPGLDLVASRIENSLLDEVIKLNKTPLNILYKEPIQKLKQQYDLIVIDCPPSLSQSVTAATLAADMVIAPVTPEKFSLSGLQTTINTLEELETHYNCSIPFGIILNKYDARTILSQKTLNMLQTHEVFSKFLFKNYLRSSQEFPNAISNEISIFDKVKPSIAKNDIDQLTREILKLETANISTPFMLQDA